jgi:HEAT repeat protein
LTDPIPLLLALFATLRGEGPFPDPPPCDAAAQVRWALERIADPADPEAREAGARMLLGLGEAAVPALIDATRSPPWRVRSRAYDLLAILGRPVPPDRLRSGLRDPNRAIRASALRAIRAPGDSALASEVCALLSDAFHDVRTEALRAALRLRLAAGADRELGQAVGSLSRDPDALVREEARRVLLAWPEDLPALDRVLDPADEPGITAALRVLLEAEETPDWLRTRCAALAGEGSLETVSRQAAAAAALIAGERSEACISAAVVGLLRAEETWLADGCARALRRVGAPAENLLARELAGPEVDLVRFRTGLALLVGEGPAALAVRLGLLEALPSGGESRADARRAEVYRSLPEGRLDRDRLRQLAASEKGKEASAAAVEAVARAEGREALPFLLERLADPFPRVRRAAALAAAQLGGDRVGDALAEALFLETDLENLRALAGACASMVRTAAVRDALTSLAVDADEGVRAAAWTGLAGFGGDPLAVSALARAYEDETERARRARETERLALRKRCTNLVHGIGRIGGGEARRFLRGVVEKLGPSEEEKDVARSAVEELAASGEEPGRLRAILDSEASSSVKVEAALALAPLGDEAASLLLEEGFRRFDLERRERALGALSERGEASPVWFLLDVAADDSEASGVREKAMAALAPFAGRPEVLSFLFETLRSGADLDARRAAIKALGLVERPGIAGRLKDLALEPSALSEDEDERRDLRREITFALAQTASVGEAPVLVRLALDEPFEGWRRSLGPSRAGRRLSSLSQYDVEGEALKALSRLGAAGEAALRERIEAGMRDGRAFLADPGFLLQVGTRLREAGPGPARALLRVASRTLAREPARRLEALLAQAEASEADGAFDEAALAYEQALEAIRERRVEPREARGVLGEEDPANAVRPSAWLRSSAALARGLAAFARGAEVEGARAFDEALEAAEPDLRASLRVARCFADRPGLAGRAVEIASRAVERVPSDRESRETLGWCRLRAGDLRGAQACFEAALALPEGDRRGEARFGLAAALVSLGREEEGAATLARALLEAPELRESAERSPYFERLRASGRFPAAASRPGR